MDGKQSRTGLRAAVTIIAAAVLASCLAGCTSTQPLEVPEPASREEPINSLALEQCVRENGQKSCMSQAM